MNSAYGGNLKAFLTNPGTGQPIDTLSDVLKSGLPWGMVIFFFQIGSEIIPIPIQNLVFRHKAVMPNIYRELIFEE